MTFLLEMQANNTISLFCEWNFKYIEGCFVAEQSKTFSWLKKIFKSWMINIQRRNAELT